MTGLFVRHLRDRITRDDWCRIQAGEVPFVLGPEPSGDEKRHARRLRAQRARGRRRDGGRR